MGSDKNMEMALKTALATADSWILPLTEVRRSGLSSGDILRMLQLYAHSLSDSVL